MNLAAPAPDPLSDIAPPPPAKAFSVRPKLDRLCCENAVSLPTPVESLPAALRTRVPLGSRDESTIAGAVEPHVSMLRRVAQRILRCPEQADDAVQDAIIALWERAERPVELRGWLVKTVIHRSLHRRRTEMRRQRWEEEASIAADVTCPLCDAEEEFARRELVEVVDAAVAGLATDSRKVIELRSQGLEYGEIAQRLELPIGTVRSRLNRARRVLRGQLALNDL